jgi:hypothetical protein
MFYPVYSPNGGEMQDLGLAAAVRLAADLGEAVKTGPWRLQVLPEVIFGAFGQELVVRFTPNPLPFGIVFGGTGVWSKYSNALRDHDLL